MMGERILVVDDEADVRRLLTYTLGREGFDTEAADCAADALLLAGRWDPQIVVLDVGLPDFSGIEVCEKLRANPEHAGVGILMLTALGDDDDKITGFTAGADDYVVKPFNVEELVLRIRALARRIGERVSAKGQKPGQLLRVGELTVDPRTHEVWAGETQISLRPLEFKLLVTLLMEPGRVFRRDELLREVWEMEVGNTRTVDVHIRRLRQNLQGCAGEIETVPGFGYRAKAPADDLGGP